MLISVYVPLLITIVIAVSAPRAAPLLAPRPAAWSLASAALVASLGWLGSLALLAFAGLVQIPEVAEEGQWSVAAVRASDPEKWLAGMRAAVMGVMFSAFSWTYVAAQIPGGMFLDRFGTKLTYYLSMTLWSLATLLQGFVTGVGTLLACRLGLGVAESPCFPAIPRSSTAWRAPVSKPC